MSDDEFGELPDDPALTALLEEAERTAAPPPPPKPVQPTPQALPKQGSGTKILVNPCQKGNPVLPFIKNPGWEWGDIVPDYVVGATACALYLSLKYHRLHPEYIYNRVRQLGRKYEFRALIIYCDVPDDEKFQLELQVFAIQHDPPLTVLTSGSYAQTAQWLCMLKREEHCPEEKLANPSGRVKSDREKAIAVVLAAKGGINKVDAEAMLRHFGNLKKAVECVDYARFLEVPGWGPAKVAAWRDYMERPVVPVTERRRVLEKGPQEDGSITQEEYDIALRKERAKGAYEEDPDGEIDEEDVDEVDPLREHEWKRGPGKGLVRVKKREDEEREKETKRKMEEWRKRKDGLVKEEVWKQIEEKWRKDSKERWLEIKKAKDQARREGREVSPDHEWVDWLDMD